jgi:hypothetical protein
MSDTKAMPAGQLKTKVLESKAAYRRHLVALPISEKLRILEEMRDTTRALQKVREENRAKVKSAWTQR